MKIKFTITNLNEPNRNNRVYTKECIEELYEKYKNIELPFVLMSKVTNDNCVLGKAKITKVDYPNLEIESETNLTAFDSLLEAKIGGVALRMVVNSDNTKECDGVTTISSISKMTSIGYTVNPSYKCYLEKVV